MLRYLIKTLLQMNLFTDTIRQPANGTEPVFNASLPSVNTSLLDWGNFTGFNGKMIRCMWAHQTPVFVLVIWS